jgi:hypothetical protein
VWETPQYNISDVRRLLIGAYADMVGTNIAVVLVLGRKRSVVDCAWVDGLCIAAVPTAPMAATPASLGNQPYVPAGFAFHGGFIWPLPRLALGVARDGVPSNCPRAQIYEVTKQHIAEKIGDGGPSLRIEFEDSGADWL